MNGPKHADLQIAAAFWIINNALAVCLQCNVFLEFGALNMETSTDADCTIDYLKMYFKK